MINYFAKFLYILSEVRIKLLILVIVFIFASLLEALGISLVGPFLNLVSHPEKIYESSVWRQVYTFFSFNSTEQFIATLGLVLILVFCIKSVLYFLIRQLIFQFSFEQRGNLCSKLLNAYLSAPYVSYLNRDTAGIISNISLETQKFCYGSMLPFLQAISNFFVLVTLIFLLAKVEFILLSLILFTILPVFFVFYILRNKAKRWGKEASEANHEIIQIVHNSLGSIKETQLIGCAPYFEEKMTHQVKRFTRSATLFQSFQILPRISIEAILIILIVAFVLFSQNQRSDSFLAVLSVFAVASIRIIPAASQLIAAIGEIQNSRYAVDVLYADLKAVNRNAIGNHKPKSSTPTGRWSSKQDALDFQYAIRLKNISYRYPNSDKIALDNVSLTLKKGESIALIGRSGAGKTTLADVILGLLSPTGGDIEVDSVSVATNPDGWRNLVGYIPQSIFLTNQTIEQNIAFGVPDHLIDSEKLTQVVAAAQLTELIEELPQGLKTRVGERGIRLSGGQRQRVGIARALYHDREILVLDEATAALDNETEQLITNAIQSLSGDKTIIVIAHRLSTVEHCDRIYLLDKGKIARAGSYQEVVAVD